MAFFVIGLLALMRLTCIVGGHTLTQPSSSSSLALSEPFGSVERSLRSAGSDGSDIRPLPLLKVTNNATNYQIIHLSCDPVHGTNLRADSCIDALGQIDGNDDTVHTYGHRNRAVVRFDFKVPQLWISSA